MKASLIEKMAEAAELIDAGTVFVLLFHRFYLSLTGTLTLWSLQQGQASSKWGHLQVRAYKVV